MSETEETERVVMMWPKALKAQVRELAGHRGMTDWTINAVQKHLTVINTSGNKTAKDAESENEQPSEPAPEEPVSVEPTPEPAFANNTKTPASSNLQPEPEVEGLPHDRTTGPLGATKREDLFTKLMAKTGGDVDFESLKEKLKPASEIPKPEPKPKDDSRCPKCGEELVDGECWTCE